MTVIELRRMAKEMGVKLGAGVNKADIVDKLTLAEQAREGIQPAEPKAEELDEEQFSFDLSAKTDEPEETEEESAESGNPESSAAPQADESTPSGFRAAWHNPASGNSRYNVQRGGYGSAQRSFGPQRRYDANEGFQQNNRTFGPRFGPAANEDRDSGEKENTGFAGGTSYVSRIQRQETPRYRSYNSRENSEERGGFNGGYSNNRESNANTGYNSTNRYYQRQGTYTQNPQRRELPADPDPNALITPAEMTPGAGVVEFHPDGYGFLRVTGFTPSSRDVYVAASIIRRYGIRAGDYVEGKCRPQREGDRYATLLLVDTINGEAPEALGVRPAYDALTAAYPTRRIQLSSQPDVAEAVRLADLFAPMGFGQRTLMLCPPDTGKTTLICDYANAIHKAHPDAEIFILLLDEIPEEVTLMRDRSNCTVVASTFDQPPETHLRMADLVLERSQRLVEKGKDVILFVDSLTHLAKTHTTASVQAGRSIPGMVNPASLYRAKKMFGAARAVREGGSLTIIGAMNIEGTNKVDDTLVEEFRSAANMALVLDTAVARTGLLPAINIQMSGTRRAELLLDDKQKSRLRLLRQTFSGQPAATVGAQICQMIGRTATNDELLEKLPDWLELMRNAKAVKN